MAYTTSTSSKSRIIFRINFHILFFSQSVLTVSQTYWCLALTQVLTSDDSKRQQDLEDFEQKSYLNLNKLAALVRQELPQVKFRILLLK